MFGYGKSTGYVLSSVLFLFSKIIPGADTPIWIATFLGCMNGLSLSLFLDDSDLSALYSFRDLGMTL